MVPAKGDRAQGQSTGSFAQKLHRHFPVNKPRKATTLRTAWRTAISLTGLCGLEIQKSHPPKRAEQSTQGSGPRPPCSDFASQWENCRQASTMTGVHRSTLSSGGPGSPGFSRTRQADCNVLADSYCGIGNLAAAHNLSLEERAPRNAPGHESRLYQSF
jgi:hypothetical protein